MPARQPLAARAEMRAPARKQHPLNERATPETRLARAAIDLMKLLEPARPPQPVHIIRNGRSPELDRLRQRLLYGLMEPQRAPPRHVRTERSRMNPRTKQALIGINVAEPAQKALIQQKAFYHGTARAQPVPQFIDGNFEGIGSKLFDLCGLAIE